MIVTLVVDTLFLSKIMQAAKEFGLEVKAAKSVEQFRETVLIAKPDLIIVDLSSKGLDPFPAIRFLQEYNMSNYGAPSPRAIGFYSPEDEGLGERALREGLTEVLPRAKFTKGLKEILKASSPAPQSGMSKLTMLIFGALVAAALYAAYHILPFYYYYYDLVNQMEQLIRVASTYSDKEIRDKLTYYIKRYEIPADPADLRIIREGKRMRISLPYSEVFYITWRGKDYDLYVFNFNAYAEGDY